MTEENAAVKEEGVFIASLKRNNKQIKEDRAEAIAESAQISYRRKVEDLDIAIKRLKRARENMLDMSPDNTQSLIVAKNFDDREFVKRDIEIGVEIRELEIEHEIAKDRYKTLFGGI